MFAFFKDKESRYFARLWWAQLISQFGDRINQMALIGLVAERTNGIVHAANSVVGLTKLLAFTIIPVFIVGPIAGAYVDRWDRRRTLFICDFLRGFLVLTIPSFFIDMHSMVPIYIVVFFAFCFSRFYVPAKMSIIPNLVSQENLLQANSLITTTGMIAFVLGCVFGGLLVERWGARMGFVIDAITFFVSGMLVISIRKDLTMPLRNINLWKTGREMWQIKKSIFTEIQEGLKYLIEHKEIRFVINMLFILLSAAGAVYVVIIVFIQQSFHSVTKHLGVLAVFLGVGLFLGALGYGRWGKKFPWNKVIFTCLIGGGIMIGVFAVIVNRYPNIFLAAGLAVTLGLIIGPIFIASNTIVHLVSDETMRGKVFSALEIVIHFAFLIAMLFSSALAARVSGLCILLVVGLIFAVVGAVGLVRDEKKYDNV